MKRLFILSTLALLLSHFNYAQEKVKPGQLAGDWKLIIDIDEAFDEAKEELKDDEQLVGSLLLSSISGLVGGLLDNVNVFFEFEKGGDLTVTVEAFGETEKESSNWKIDNRGRLYLDYEDSFSINEESYWMLQNNILVNYDENDEPNNIYLVKIL
ncbi:hypothetical protein [Marinoscillum sp. MHG1-6]|uniref:hypothetical protein n=1 Tax=Marinoscillum sp. MHG1-6 TaxID=2959627 RepID=UPI00215844DD|nr:hypothetical protein [Marinoscillum sp. MHG1-6]